LTDHTNRIENFWSLLKRTLKGTYVSVEPFHLFRYLHEQAYRFDERKRNDGERFGVASSVAGRRLTYAELTGKTESTADPDRRKQWRGKRQRGTLALVKSPKVEDLKFEPGAAFDCLRKLAHGVLTVKKGEIDQKAIKQPRRKRPLSGARS
jgi:hypothetical protein